MGEHDRRRQQGADALRRHRLDPQRPQLQGDRLLERLRSGDVPDARPADARRLAPGVRARAGAGRALAGDLRQLVAAAAAAQRLRRQQQRLLLAHQPRAAARGLPADRRRRAHAALAADPPRAEDDRAAPGRHRRPARQPVHPQPGPQAGVPGPPLRRRAVARPAGGLLQRAPDDGRLERAGRRQRGVPRARRLGPAGQQRQPRRAAVPALHRPRGRAVLAAVRRRRSRSTPRPGSTPPPSTRRSRTRSPTCRERTSRSTRRTATSTTSCAARSGSRSPAAPAPRGSSTRSTPAGIPPPATTTSPTARAS